MRNYVFFLNLWRLFILSLHLGKSNRIRYMDIVKSTKGTILNSDDRLLVLVLSLPFRVSIVQPL